MELLAFQFYCDLLKVADDPRPALLAQRRNHLVLRGTPGWKPPGQCGAPLFGDKEFDMAASSATPDTHQAVALQGTKISQERRAFHCKPFAQLSHGPSVFCLQGTQNRWLGRSEPLATYLRVKELCYHTRRAPHIKAGAVLLGRHIQFLHSVYIHNRPGLVKCDFFISGQR